MKIKSKILSLILTLVMVFTLSAIPASAVSADTSTMIDTSSLPSISLSDLERGIDVVIVKDGSSLKAVTQEQRKSIKRAVIDFGTFHVGIVKDSSTKAHLYWSATGTQITNVSGTIYCSNTSILKPKSYFSGRIDEYKHLNGRYNKANGSTKSFSIPKNTKKVKVGWKNVYITTIAGGKAYLGNASSTVKL